MAREYYQIRDNCRKGLLKYMEKAFSIVPKTEKPKILDIGCGTGVPTLWLAENYDGIIIAIDTDKNALDWLQDKIVNNSFENKIKTGHISFFDLKPDPDYFDIILAEGFLNIVGFEQGFSRIIGMLKNNGYFIIHDEYKDHEEKSDFISKNSCKLIDTLFLDENVWWNDYYKQLETELNSVRIRQTRDLFKSELKEIEFYKLNPTAFRSIYYVVRKNCT
jgi:cyclopropane fatty-acyl-phospholipid synthase-like methyltransferase